MYELKPKILTRGQKTVHNVQGLSLTLLHVGSIYVGKVFCLNDVLMKIMTSLENIRMDFYYNQVPHEMWDHYMFHRLKPPPHQEDPKCVLDLCARPSSHHFEEIPMIFCRHISWVGPECSAKFGPNCSKLCEMMAILNLKKSHLCSILPVYFGYC